MSNKRDRREYNDEERQKLLDYVIEKKEFYRLKGRAFWQVMEHAAPVDRSWQSAKEQFHKHIMRYLGRFKVSEENEKLLRFHCRPGKPRIIKTKKPEKPKRDRIEIFTESDDSASSVQSLVVQRPHKPTFRKQQLSQKEKEKVDVDFVDVDIHKPSCSNSKQYLSRKRKLTRREFLDFSDESDSYIEQTNKPAPTKKHLSEKAKEKITIPIETVPIEAGPIEPVPIETVPIEPVPIEPVLIETMSIETVPIEPVLIETMSIEPVPIETGPIETVPIKPVPIEPVHIETMSIESMSIEIVPIKSEPIEIVDLCSDSSETPDIEHTEQQQQQHLSQKGEEKISVLIETVDLCSDSSETPEIEHTIQQPKPSSPENPSPPKKKQKIDQQIDQNEPAPPKQQLPLKKTQNIDQQIDQNKSAPPKLQLLQKKAPNIDQQIDQNKPASPKQQLLPKETQKIDENKSAPPKQQLSQKKTQNIGQQIDLNKSAPPTKETADLRLLTCQTILNKMIKSQKNLSDCRKFVQLVVPLEDNIEALKVYNFLLAESESENNNKLELEDPSPREMVMSAFDEVAEDRASEELMNMLSLLSTPPPSPPVNDTNDTDSDMSPCLLVQPQIRVSLKDIENNTTPPPPPRQNTPPDINVPYSQVLSPLNPAEISITNIISRMMEEDEDC